MSKDYFVIDFLRFTGYAESLKTHIGGYAPDSFGVFFAPVLRGFRAGNISNTGHGVPIWAISATPTRNLCGLLKTIGVIMKKSIKELQTENELLRATLALVMEKLKELTELLNGGCHE